MSPDFTLLTLLRWALHTCPKQEAQILRVHFGFRYQRGLQESLDSVTVVQN